MADVLPDLPHPAPVHEDRPPTGEVEPRWGRGAAIGYVIGFLVVATGITVGGSLGGLGFGPSLGLGCFVGAWGGGGFGFMLGGTLPLAHQLDQAAHRSAGGGPAGRGAAGSDPTRRP
jgi:hypothetical protein